MAEDEKTDAAVRELRATARVTSLPSFLLFFFFFVFLLDTQYSQLSVLLGFWPWVDEIRGLVSLDSFFTNVLRRVKFLSKNLYLRAARVIAFVGRRCTRRFDIRYRCFIHKRHV